MNQYIPAIIYTFLCIIMFLAIIYFSRKSLIKKEKYYNIKYIVKKTVIQETHFLATHEELVKMMKDSSYAQNYASKFGTLSKTLDVNIIQYSFVDRDKHLLELSEDGKTLEAYDA